MMQRLMLSLFLLQAVAHVSMSNRLFEKYLPKGEWESNAKIVAGGHGEGDGLDQFNSTYGLFVDSNDTLFVADYFNHRVVKWNRDASTGTIVAGGQCGRIDLGQLCHPAAIIFDSEGTMFITVEAGTNGSVISWKKDATSGETIITANTSLYGIALDAEEKYLYVGHHREHRVVKYTTNGTFESVVAGGNGSGPAPNQLDYPRGVAVDKSGSVYVSDSRNHRVVKWTVNATEGVVVAGGNGNGSQIDQLNIPTGIVVDEQETIYVADGDNHRIVSIAKGTRNGMVIAGGRGPGDAPNQLYHPESLVFNSQGDLYVSDWENFRVQMFPKAKSPASGSHSDYLGNVFHRWTLIYCCFLLSMISIVI